MINVAVIGTGYIGKVHLETLLHTPGVRVVALADNNIAMAQELADRYGIARVTPDYKDLLQDADIQAVHNCTPNHLHYDINLALLRAGKEVLSEKPLALTAAQAKELYETARQNDRLTGINFCYRYYPAVQEAAARVRAGEIGAVHSVFGAFFQDWLLYDTDYNWRLDKRFTGESNTAADIGSHWMDLAQFVTNAHITEVMADLHTVHPIRKRSKGAVLTFAKQGEAQEYDEVPVEVDDSGSILVHFDNGSSGTFMVNQLAAGRKVTIDLQVFGTQASLAWNHERPAVLWSGFRDKANEVSIESPLLQHPETTRYALLPSGHPMGYHDAIFNLFGEFYEALQNRNAGKPAQPNLPGFWEGYFEMAIVEAIVTSHNQKRWVKVTA